MTEYVRQGNPNWYKGQPSANPAGRPRTRMDSPRVRKVREDALVAMAEHVAETPIPTEPRSAIQILKDFANDTSIPTALRISAATSVAPYEQPRLMSVPAPVFIYTPIEVPDFASIEDAESFLLQLSKREGIQELESQAVEAISTRIRDWIDSKRQGQELELKRLNANVSDRDQTIRIEGGLPVLPGCENMILPEHNDRLVLKRNGDAVLEGHEPQGLLNPQPGPRTIEHNSDPLAIESTQANDHGEQT